MIVVILIIIATNIYVHICAHSHACEYAHACT